MTQETPRKKKRRHAKKKRLWIPITILVLLIVVRLLLPYFVKKSVNKTLADIPGYYGQVEDIDIAIWRGAYVIHGLYLNKSDGITQVPFLNFEKTDISVQWDAIWDGRIVSEIEMINPHVNYVFEDQQQVSEEGNADVDDWTKVLTDLVPIDINKLQITNGKLGFVQLATEPNIDLYMDQVNIVATNLRNVKEKERILPSNVKGDAVSIGQGKVTLEGNMNLLKDIPDMDFSLSLEDANLEAINSMTSGLAGIDFESGKFDVYSEIAIADSYMKGYIKPLIRDAKYIGKEDGFFETIWEGFISFFDFILTNPRTDNLATNIPFEGDLSQPQPDVWATVFNVFENGWFNAFKGQTDDKINFEDTAKEADINAQDLSRKEKRELRREQRRKDREAKKAAEEIQDEKEDNIDH